MFDRKIVEDALQANISTEVAHYTRIGTLCKLIAPEAAGWGSAWATPVQFLNDRMELALGLDILGNVAETVLPKGHRAQTIVVQLQSSTGSLATDAFQMSFSGDRLVPYVDYLRGGLQLPIFRIIIGPGWQLATLNSLDAARNHVVQGIARLLMARGLHQVAIDRSRIPYDPK